MHGEALNRDAWTAGGLRPGALALPAVGAELFIQAGAIVAERAALDTGHQVEVVLRRASDQAALLLRGAKAAGGQP
jgi:hypothetical protein